MADLANQNRTEFLNHIAQKLGVNRQKPQDHPFQPVNHLPETTLAGLSQEELLAVAKKRVEKINTSILETTKTELAATINALIKKIGAGRIIVPTDQRFATFGLSRFAGKTGQAEPDVCFWKKGSEFREENITNAANATIGIAFAEFLLAESGSIVVETSAGQGRSLHFLPKHYISIIPMSRIVPSSTQAAAFYSEQLTSQNHVGSAIHFISGPSNSGDIEMQLVVGLHGPLAVYYVVVKDC